MTQYYSRIDTTLNGDVYNIPFSYMKESEISVYINDEPITAWEFLNESQIKINEMPSEIPADAIISIRRTTDITKKVVDYTNQSMLKKENLNLSQNQLLNAVQEIYDNNVQFEIDTENNILQNRTEIDAQIEANKQELLDIQSSFESEVTQTIANNKQELEGEIQNFENGVNTTIAQNKADTDKQIADFEQEVNTTIDTVKEAAEKVNNLEQAVEEAKTAAQTATTKADETQEVLANAITEMDSKLATAESTMDSRLSSATATMNEKLSAANTAVENATQQAELATQKAQEIIDINPANTNLSNLTEEGIQVIKDKSGGSGLELCDIGMALYVDETKGLRRYLNGQIVDINTNTQAFLNRLKQITTLYPSLLCTEDEWQTAKTMSAFGQVGKFVFNYADDGVTVVSVRIPAIVNVQGLFDLQNLGLTVEAGLPDHLHNVSRSADISNENITTETSGSDTISNYNGAQAKTTSKASLSNPIYGNSNTVQPEAIQYPYFIQIATGSETENNIINEIELNNPYSLFDSKYSDHELNNLSWLKSEGQWNAKAVYPTAYDKLLKVYNGTETVVGLSVKLSTETYTDYDFVLNTSDETFRLPLLDGSEDLPSDRHDSLTLLASGTTYTAPANGWMYLLANTGTDIQMYSLSGLGLSSVIHSNNINLATYLPCKKGDIVQIVYTISNLNRFEFVYAQGNGSLYYYVGETVQNANLIDAGRIGEQLATKTDMLQASGAGMPSSRYIDLTLGASDSTYTAPANGWVTASGHATTANQWGKLRIYATKIAGGKNYSTSSLSNGSSSNPYIDLILPVKKGYTFVLQYTGISVDLLRFWYAVGSEGEV